MELTEEQLHLSRVRDAIMQIFSKLSALDLSAASRLHARATIRAVANTVTSDQQIASIAAGRVIDCLMWL